MAETTVVVIENHVTAVEVVETPATAVDVIELTGLQGPPGPPGLPGPPGAGVADPAPPSMYMGWLLGLQYNAPGQPAHGAIKWHDSVATRVGGQDYFRIEPYFAHMAAIFALEADAPAAREFAARWINWWASHRNPVTHTAWVAYANEGGSHVATALPGAVPPVHPDTEDATDSNLALWLLLLGRYVALFGPQDLDAGWQQHAREVFDFLYSPAVRDPADGMTWATPTYPIKYLMDNVEVWAGVDAASALFALLGDATRRDQARAWADALRARIVADLWNEATGLWAVHKDGAGNVQHASLVNAYPDVLAQVWPAIFGMDTTRGGYATVAWHWTGWTFGDVAAAGGSADAALALAAAYAGRPLDARRWLLACAAKQTPGGTPPYPFLCMNAAMAAVAATRGLGTGGAPVQTSAGASGLRFLGAQPNVGSLPATGQPGDAWAVAGRLYVRTTAGAWVDAGPVGAPGTDGRDGQIRFTGHGEPPAVIVGAQPGDTYLDLNTGNVYRLV